MVNVTVWFDHGEGPQGYESEWTSKEATEEAYDGEDPDLLGIQAEGEPLPPLVADYYRATCPLCRQRAREERTE